MSRDPTSAGVSITTHSTAAAEAECHRQNTQGMMIGGIAGGVIGYGLHNYMMKNTPSYASMGQGGKLALGAVLLGGSVYLVGQFMENRCRRLHGLPATRLEIKK